MYGHNKLEYLTLASFKASLMASKDTLSLPFKVLYSDRFRACQYEYLDTKQWRTLQLIYPVKYLREEKSFISLCPGDNVIKLLFR